ncbi:MAG: hypothetical protein RR500_05585 [Bacilli bacterium]
MNDINKNKTKTINEKIKIFTKEEVIDISYFEEWRSVRTLLNENYFKIMLEEMNISKNQFSYALQPLNDEFKLHTNVKNEEWIKCFNRVINNFNYKNINYKVGLYLPIQPFSVYLQEKLK